MGANGELVGAIYERWARGDFSDASWADPEIEFVLEDGPTPGTWRGARAMSSTWGEMLGAFQELRAEAEEIREIDAERVMVLTTNKGRGTSSGVELGPMGTRGANVFDIRDGKVVRLALYWNRDRCPEASTG
jgi:ketosteroid isomerase-like protein